MSKGWNVASLVELCEFQRGLTYSKSDEVSMSKNIVLRANNIDVHTNNLDFGDIRYIADAVKVSANKKVRKGSILICTASGSKSHLGKIAYIDKDYGYAFGGFMGQITATDKLVSRYLYYVLTSPKYKEFIRKLSDGVNINNLKFDDLKYFEVNYPLLREQQRIVAILDEAFEAIATARANAEQNLQNVRALFESHLESVFTQRDDGWKKMKLSEATEGVFTGPFGSLLHKRDYIENGIPLVNPTHITDTGIEPDLRKTVAKETAQRLTNYIIREGDIVIARRGEMGRCALVTDIEDGWLCGTGSFLIKPSSRCDARYLVRFLRSATCKKKLEKIAGGAVMPNLSNTDLGNLVFDVPPLEHQKVIIEKIAEITSEIQRLEALYLQKIAALDELKKSLLHRAFSGQL